MKELIVLYVDRYGVEDVARSIAEALESATRQAWVLPRNDSERAEARLSRIIQGHMWEAVGDIQKDKADTRMDRKDRSAPWTDFKRRSIWARLLSGRCYWRVVSLGRRLQKSVLR